MRWKSNSVRWNAYMTMRTTMPISSLSEWHVPLLPRQSVSRDEITQKRLLGPFFTRRTPKKSFQPARREKKVGKKLPFSYFLVRIFSHFSCSFLAMIYGPRDFSPWKIKRRVFAEKSKLGLEKNISRKKNCYNWALTGITVEICPKQWLSGQRPNLQGNNIVKW